jgi:hypothetical protein
MLLAITIFCLVAVSLTTALNQSIDTATILRDEAQVRREMQNYLAEAGLIKLQPGKIELRSADGRVQYERQVRRISPRNDRGQTLNNLLEVTIRANWVAVGQARTSVASLVVYQP